MIMIINNNSYTAIILLALGNKWKTYEISGSHGGEFEVQSLLEYTAV
jgi:hypothetical protein